MIVARPRRSAVTIMVDDRMDSANHQMLHMSSTLTDHAGEMLTKPTFRHQLSRAPQ